MARRPTTSDATYDARVFLNVPFDRQFAPIFRALVFAVHDCGFQARCALESDDGSVVRMDKLLSIMEQSRLGIHDISRTSLDRTHRLPRFNMPLELGLFLGAKRFGSASQKRKGVLVLDKEQYRYQRFCSDISGQDVRAHENKPTLAIGAVRNWLQVAGERHERNIPSSKIMVQRYELFRREMPVLCAHRGLDIADLTFFDFQTLVVGWLAVNQDWRAHQAYAARR